jgi:hypothetical protein
MHGIFQKWRKNRARYLNNSGRSACETDVRELFRKPYVIIVFTALSTSLILSYPRKKDSEHAGPANLASLGG